MAARFEGRWRRFQNMKSDKKVYRQRTDRTELEILVSNAGPKLLFAELVGLTLIHDND
jgi:hypothetical protein